MQRKLNILPIPCSPSQTFFPSLHCTITQLFDDNFLIVKNTSVMLGKKKEEQGRKKGKRRRKNKELSKEKHTNLNG